MNSLHFDGCKSWKLSMVFGCAYSGMEMVSFCLRKDL